MGPDVFKASLLTHLQKPLNLEFFTIEGVQLLEGIGLILLMTLEVYQNCSVNILSWLESTLFNNEVLVQEKILCNFVS